MVGFYKHDIPAWMDGTEGLSDGAYRTYHVIVQLIMLNEGPIALNERGIAGRCNQSIKSFRVHLDALFAAGKLILVDGRLSNPRAQTELQAVMKNRANASLGGLSGKKSAQKSSEQGVSNASAPDGVAIDAAKTLKNNDASEAPLNIGSSLKEKRREDTPIVPKGTDPEGFTEFRAAYPRRSTAFPTTQARKRWLEARRRGAKPDEIIAGARAYAAEQSRIGKVGTEFVQSADVWLNRQRWGDYLDAEASPQPKPSAPVSDETWRERVLTWRARGGHWPWRPCPPPDDPRTLVPHHVLAEFGLRAQQHGQPPALMTGTR